MLKKNFFQKSGQLCPKVPQTNQDELSPAHELPKFNRGHSQRKSLKIKNRSKVKKWKIPREFSGTAHRW